MTLTTSVTWQGVTEKGVVARTILRKLSFPNSRATLLTFRTTTLALSTRRQDMNQDRLKEQFYSDCWIKSRFWIKSRSWIKRRSWIKSRSWIKRRLRVDLGSIHRIKGVEVLLFQAPF